MVQSYCLLALLFIKYRQCAVRSLTVCGCKQNIMKTSICLVANFEPLVSSFAFVNYHATEIWNLE